VSSLKYAKILVSEYIRMYRNHWQIHLLVVGVRFMSTSTCDT